MKTGIIRSRFSKDRDSRQGSAMLTTVIFSFLVVTLMGSYLYLSSGEYRLATRSFLSNASFNLAEGGLDLALDALRTKSSSGWTKNTDGSGRKYWARVYDDYDLGGNIVGEIKIVILNPGSKTPEIYSEGIAKGHLAGDVKKQLYAHTVSGFMPFKNGFNSKEGIVLKGSNVIFDSYDSRNGPYGPGNRNSEISVSTISVEVDAIDIGNASVYGYVATGGAMPNVGPKGSITNYANPGKVDDSRVTTDYYAEFPNIDPPALISPLTSMPSSGTILGGEYLLTSWSSNSSSPLYIAGDTTIVITGDMNLSGNGSIVIDPSATLKIYTEGDVSLGGKGVLNGSAKPSQLMIFGTNSTLGEQEFSISGNGFLSASVYAPNAEVAMNGGGTDGRVFGAVAAYDARLVGNSHFSYDEALADYNIGTGGYVVDEWAELAGVSLTSISLNMGDYGL